MYDPKYDWQALYKTRKVSSSLVYFYEFFFIVLLFSGCEFFIINFLLLLEHFPFVSFTQKRIANANKAHSPEDITCREVCRPNYTTMTLLELLSC